MPSSFPDQSLPSLWCDFIACGWSGDAGDDCYYAFDEQVLATLNPSEGDAPDEPIPRLVAQ